MKKIIPLLILLTLLSAGCEEKNAADQKDKVPCYQAEYESEDQGGTVSYRADGKKYQYLLEVTGRSNNAAQDSYYILLSNEKDITFKQADQQYYGSDTSQFGDFFIVESGWIERSK